MSLPRSGYTLPVFACAAAIAALRWLRQPQPLAFVTVELLEPAGTVEIPIEQVAGIRAGVALAVTRSDPGDNLDLTRNTPLWAVVEWGPADQAEPIHLQGGEGVGKQLQASSASQPAIYAYARRLFQENLGRWLETAERIQVTVILPEGRSLAKRTSNEAFGVVEGLSLLGTSGISQPLSAPQQLESFRAQLREKALQFDCLVFCVGENGLDLSCKLGINPAQTLKTANWLGPLLVEAGMQNLKAILLLGYHGKLLKLAGGIFHTHHHVADARQEIFTAHAANFGLPLPVIQKLFSSPTVE
ncbi:MAG TPA: cobalt-precorrin-5B (C(1))-methyltransferase CbiD, partial [Candidatus Caenarcaniphilales bacterium]